MTATPDATIPTADFIRVVRAFNEGAAPDTLLSWKSGEDVYFEGRLVTIRPPDRVVTGRRPAVCWDMAKWTGWTENDILATAEKLIHRGLIRGCSCGCRGDFEVLD